MSICVQVFVFAYFFISLGCLYGNAIMGHIMKLCFGILKNCHIIFQS